MPERTHRPGGFRLCRPRKTPRTSQGKKKPSSKTHCILLGWRTYPITMSPRFCSVSHRPGPEPRGLGTTVRWLPAPAPRGARAATCPRDPGASAPRPPSPAPRAPLTLLLPPRRARDPRARRDAASGAPCPTSGAHGRGGSRGSGHGFPLRTLRSGGGWMPQRGLQTLGSLLPHASARTGVGRIVANTPRPFPPSLARAS